MVARDKTAATSTGHADRTTEKLLAQVQELSDQLALVDGVLRTITAGAPLNEVLQAFASNVKLLCPFDTCSVAVYDEERNLFHVPYVAAGGRVTGPTDRPFESAVLSEVVRGGKPLLRRNVREDFGHFGGGPAVGCDMIFPLQVGTRPFGTFNVGPSSRNAWMNIISA
jgi:hypothetical protein